jgi:hypothetical protein
MGRRVKRDRFSARDERLEYRNMCIDFARNRSAASKEWFETHTLTKENAGELKAIIKQADEQFKKRNENNQ